MSDSEKSLDILIKTKADLAGAKAANEELAKFGRLREANGRFVSKAKWAEMDEEARQALVKLNEETRNATKETDKLEFSHRGLHKVLSMLGRQTVPEFGEALSGALYGPLGYVIALEAAIALLAKVIGDAAQKTKELADKQAELDTAIWTAQRDAANSAADAAFKYAEALEKIATQTDAVKKAETLELAVLEARKQAQLEILKAQEAAEIANAGGDKTKEEEIKRRYGEKTSLAGLKGEADTIAAEARHKQNRETGARGLKEKADAAERAYESALANPEAAKLTEGRKSFADDQAALDKEAGKYNLGAMRDELARAEKIKNPEESQSQRITWLANEIKAGETALQAAEDNKRTVAEYDAAILKQKESVEKAKDAMDKSAAAFTENQKVITELNDDLEKRKAILNIHKGTTETIERIQAQPSPYAAPLKAEERDAIKDLTGLADQVPSESQNLLLQLGFMISGHTTTLKEAAQLVARANASDANFTATMKAVTQNASAMATYSKQSAQILEAHTKDIEILYARIRNLKGP